MCGDPEERYRHGCSLGVAPASAVDDMSWKHEAERTCEGALKLGQGCIVTPFMRPCNHYIYAARRLELADVVGW